MGLISLLEPSHGPENVSSIEVDYTKYQITWNSLTRQVANGLVKMYQVRLDLKESCTSFHTSFNSTFNTSKTEILLSSLSMCTRYEVSVRAFTEAGPGPYSQSLAIQTLGESKMRDMLTSTMLVYNPKTILSKILLQVSIYLLCSTHRSLN